MPKPTPPPRRPAPVPPARRQRLTVLVTAFRHKIRTYQALHAAQGSADEGRCQAEFAQAEAAFEAQLAAALALGELGPTLFAMAGPHGVVPDELAHVLNDHLNRRAQARLVETVDGPIDGVLVGLVVHAPERAAWATRAWQPALQAALEQALGPDVTWRALPQLLHPLAWGQLILDHRLATFNELQQGIEGPGHAAVRAQDALQCNPKAPYPTGIALQLVWVGRPAVDDAPLEEQLRQSLLLPAWGKFKAAVNTDTTWTEAPLMVEDALAYSLIHHLRRQQADEVGDPRTIALKDTVPVPNQPKLRLEFADGERALTPRFVPFTWMGTTRQAMENTLNQLGTAWKS